MPVILAHLLLKAQVVYWMAAGDGDDGVKGYGCLQRAGYNPHTYTIHRYTGLDLKLVALCN
jgi:hypothetical protein